MSEDTPGDSGITTVDLTFGAPTDLVIAALRWGTVTNSFSTWRIVLDTREPVRK